MSDEITLFPWRPNDLTRCCQCGALWWWSAIPGMGLRWSLRTPSAGKCCESGIAMEQYLDLVCEGYEGSMFRGPEAGLAKRVGVK